MNKMRHFLLQFSVKLDELLHMLCTDIKADDVESAEKALESLEERSQSICKNLYGVISLEKTLEK